MDRRDFVRSARVAAAGFTLPGAAGLTRAAREV